MFYLGLYKVFEALKIGVMTPMEPDAEIAPDALAVINVIEGLDRFLIAIVLLYFAYGVYSLFIHPKQVTEEATDELALPFWMRVNTIGQLKQVVAEVIVVIIFVLFLRLALQVFHDDKIILSWQQMGTLLVLPICIGLLSISLRMVELHPKKRDTGKQVDVSLK